MATCAMLVHRNTVFRPIFSRLYISKSYSTDVVGNRKNVQETEIVVPYRIQRGPTDILKALSTTISKDFTAANHKYHDDPYFIPINNATKRAFALSKESGKKAARYFLENYPEFFKCNTSEPPIKAFDPPVKYSETDNVSEKTLKDCAASLDIASSLSVYAILKQKDISFSQDTKQMLLELLCFYDSDETPSLDFPEERWFSFHDKRTKKKWKNCESAQQLFDEMDQDSGAYCTMIQGASKHLDVKKAFELYEEMCAVNLPANTQTYNGLLSVVPIDKENGDLRWEKAMELVSNMNKDGLFPDLYTMNALLNICSRSLKWKKNKAIAIGIIAEMERLGIEPSLGSYHHVLKAHVNSYNLCFSALADVMKKVEGRQFEIRHPDDVLFFSTAMGIACKYAQDKDLAYRVLALLEMGTNNALIGSAVQESLFYRNLIGLLSQCEEFEKFMEFYHKYVPNVYTPEPNLMIEILHSLELSGAYRHLPQIGTDLLMFEQSDRENVINEFLRIAACVKHEPEIQQRLVDLTLEILNITERRQEQLFLKTVQWTGVLLGNMLKIFLYGEDLEKAWVAMSKLRNAEYSIIGYPPIETLLELCTMLLEKKDFMKVDFCVKYAENSFYPNIKADLQEVIRKLHDSGKLNSAERDEISHILSLTEEQESALDHEKNESEKKSEAYEG